VKDAVLGLLSSWQFLVVTAVFVGIIVAVGFNSRRGESRSVPQDRLVKRSAGTNTKERTDEPDKEEPGMLYVPNSNYEILKREGLIHPPDED
jgi:hypothetical protein